MTLKDYPTREDALLWIVTNQITRRNLTPTQRAALAVELEKELAKEANRRKRLSKEMMEKFPSSQKGPARDKAAKMYQVNPYCVTNAKKIEQDAPFHVQQEPQAGGDAVERFVAA